MKNDYLSNLAAKYGTLILQEMDHTDNLFTIMEQGSSSNVLLNNWNMNVGEMFRSQLNEETKLVILYALKDLPIEIKTLIIDEVDIYLDNEINDLENYTEEYWYRDGDLYFNDFEDYFDHLQLKNYLETHPDYDSYPDTN